MPVAAEKPLRTQQLAHKRWLDPLVATYGGRVRLALRADVMHAFALDLEPPRHYYATDELDDEELSSYYADLAAELADRIRKNLPHNFDDHVEQMRQELINRGLPVPETVDK